MSLLGRLHPDDLERLAELVADRLVERLERRPFGHASRSELVTATEIAQRFGVSAEFVRDHADELGVVRIGTGPRPRLRFDPVNAAEWLAARYPGNGSPTPDPARRLAKPLRARRSTGSGRPLLPVEGLEE